MVGITPMHNPHLRREGESLEFWMDRIDLDTMPTLEGVGARGWLDSLSGAQRHAVVSELNRQLSQIHYAGTTARDLCNQDLDTLKRIMRNR